MGSVHWVALRAVTDEDDDATVAFAVIKCYWWIFIFDNIKKRRSFENDPKYGADQNFTEALACLMAFCVGYIADKLLTNYCAFSFSGFSSFTQTLFSVATSAEEVTFSPAFCLFVCQQDYEKNTRPIFINFGAKTEHWPRKKSLHFK